MKCALKAALFHGRIFPSLPLLRGATRTPLSRRPMTTVKAPPDAAIKTATSPSASGGGLPPGSSKNDKMVNLGVEVVESRVVIDVVSHPTSRRDA